MASIATTRAASPAPSILKTGLAVADGARIECATPLVKATGKEAGLTWRF